MHNSPDDNAVQLGWSFRRCDRPHSQSCVLSNDYCHDNETADYAIAGDADGYGTYNCCRRQSNASSEYRPRTWYYFHLRRGMNDSTELSFEFEAKELEPSLKCDNESRSGDQDGQVPTMNKKDDMRRRDTVNAYTFEISGNWVGLNVKLFYRIASHRIVTKK